MPTTDANVHPSWTNVPLEHEALTKVFADSNEFSSSEIKRLDDKLEKVHTQVHDLPDGSKMPWKMWCDYSVESLRKDKPAVYRELGSIYDRVRSSTYGRGKFPEPFLTQNDSSVQSIYHRAKGVLGYYNENLTKASSKALLMGLALRENHEIEIELGWNGGNDSFSDWRWDTIKRSDGTEIQGEYDQDAIFEAATELGWVALEEFGGFATDGGYWDGTITLLIDPSKPVGECFMLNNSYSYYDYEPTDGSYSSYTF